MAYQVWGTSFQEGHTQNQLRHQLQQEATNAAVKRALAEAAALNKLPTGPPVVAPTTKAPAEGKPVGVIRIPLIHINQVVVQGTATQDLRKGPGHYVGSPLPGQARQRRHRRAPDHLRASLLQPERVEEGRPRSS